MRARAHAHAHAHAHQDSNPNRRGESVLITTPQEHYDYDSNKQVWEEGGGRGGYLKSFTYFIVDN